MKVGRNEPCPCGSGKKHKKCHGAPERKAASVNGAVGPNEELSFGGHRFWSVGSRVYSRPGEMSFHEFVVGQLQATLGKDFWNSEMTKPLGERHQILRWYEALVAWKSASATDENAVPGGWAATPSGDVLALHSLAKDLYDLESTGNVLPRMIGRIRSRDHFQGARYELAVSAIFARLGYKLMDLESDSGSAQPEFRASRPDGVVLTVEAKSRHRPGVLHQPGERVPEKEMVGSVEKLVKDALKKDPGGEPYLIFIDVNSPLTPGTPGLDKPWLPGVRHAVEKLLPRPTPESPDPFTAIVITNWAFHYAGEELPPPGEVALILSLNPRVGVPAEVIREIQSVANAYSADAVATPARTWPSP